jgi:hypothetical protein
MENYPTWVMVCNNCYKPGHKRSECPALNRKEVKAKDKVEIPKPHGRAFQITAKEAKVDPDVVTGTFLVNSIPAHVLFDTGANKLFVSFHFIRNPSFIVDKLLVPLEVEVADNKSFLVFDVCRNCKLTIEDENYLIDLIPMTMGEFKVVVGMDWFSRHHANVNCNRKVIKLISPSGRHISIQGGRRCNYMLCSLMKARKYVQHGCKAYLTYVRDIDMETMEIKMYW